MSTTTSTAAPDTAHLSPKRFWSLDPQVCFLNHGSFGACPTEILARQRALADELEREPVRFMAHALPALLTKAREALGAFVGADPVDLALVNNASTGVSTVLRSLAFAPGDEIVITNHGYNACNNAARFVAERAGAKVVTAKIPFPIHSADEAFDAIMAAVTPRTKLALLDHVTSPTALVLPVERLVPALAAKGVDALIDGAHAPGMLPLELVKLGAAYYTGNCHKWLCTPKGSAFLHVRRDRQERIRPLVISHGANAPLADGMSRFRAEFDWTGTDDPTPWIVIPDAIAHVAAMHPGGWDAIRARNHALAVEAQAMLAEALHVAAPAPADMLGAMTALPLPDGEGSPYHFDNDPLQLRLWDEHRIEVFVATWPATPKRVIRAACPVYVTRDDIATLARALAG